MDTQHNNIQEAVTKKIKAGMVRMHSPLHFAIRTIILVGVLIATLMVSAVIINFIFFSIHLNNHDTLLQFGPRGWLTFIHFFPWPLLFLDILLMYVLLSMVRTFRAGYSLPVLYLTLPILLLIVMGGSLIERHTPLNMRVMEEAEHRHMSSPFFHEPPEEGEGTCMCEIVEIKDDRTFIARDIHTQELRTIILDASSRHATTSGLTTGSIVFIAGEYDGDNDADDIIYAFGLRLMHPMSPMGGMMIIEEDETSD